MPRPTKNAVKYKNVMGRPPKIDETTLAKLEDAFMNAFTDEMACIYAGINPSTLYRYIEANPDFGERKEMLKKSPNLLAQKTIVKDIENVGGARYWAERRMPEFMPKSKIEHSGGIDLSEGAEMSTEEKAALEVLRAARRKRIEANSDKMA